MTVTITYSLDTVVGPTIATATESDTVGLAGGGWATIYTEDGMALANFYDADGNLLNTRSPGLSDGAIAQLANGNVVMISTDDGTNFFYELADSTGNFIASGTVTPDVATAESNADVAGLTGGGFVVVDQQDMGGGNTDIFVHIRDDAAGIVADFKVDATSAIDENASVTALTNGNFLVTWDRQDDGNSEIWAAEYDADGSAVVAPSQIDPFGSHNLKPSVTALAGGGFALSYQDNQFNGSDQISTIAYDGVGNILSFTQTSAMSNLGDSEAATTTLSNGLIVTSFTDNYNGTDLDILASIIDPATGLLTDNTNPLQIAYTFDGETASSLSALSLARFVATWTDATDGAVHQAIEQLVRTSIGDDSGNVINGDDARDIETGGAGNDTLNGAANSDLLTAGGGSDTINGGTGDDFIVMGANLDANDKIDGGGEIDVVELNGNYSAGVVFNATTMLNIYEMNLDAGHSYKLTTHNATVAAGHNMLVVAWLGAGETLTFDGSLETDGTFGIYSGAGNDSIIGGRGNDSFSPGTGNDTVSGGNGNDRFYFGTGELNNQDKLDGGTGSDTVSLDGNYAAGVTLNATTMVNVEIISLTAGNSYKLTTNQTTVAAGKQMTIDGSLLGAGETLTFNGSQETDGSFKVLGGLGNDTITASAGNDTVNSGGGNDTVTLTAGGNDTVNAGDGDDTMKFGATFTAADKVNGGFGNDVVQIDGNYSAGLVLGATTLVDVETLTLAANNNYVIFTNDGNLSSGATLTVNATALGTSFTYLYFDGNAETGGRYVVLGGSYSDNLIGGHGNDTLTGNNGNDALNMSFGGNDTAKGGSGNDTINAGAQLTNADTIDGGADQDTVVLNGDYSTQLSFSNKTMANVETLSLAAGHSYNLKMASATVAAGEQLKIDGTNLGSGDSLTFDGTKETDGSYDIKGGAGNDVISGGRLSDKIDAGTGANILLYTSVVQSTGPHADIIYNFDFFADKFDLNVAVTSVHDKFGGALNQATYDSDLAAAINPAEMATHGAVVFYADSGDLANHKILVVDANGVAGYQAGADYVIDVSFCGTAGVDVTDFI